MRKKLLSTMAIVVFLLNVVTLTAIPATAEESFKGKPRIVSGSERALAKIHPSLREVAITGGAQVVKVTIATVDPNQVFDLLRCYTDLGLMGKKKARTGKLVTLVLDVPAKSLIKVASLPSVAYILNYELHEPLPPPDPDVMGIKPDLSEQPMTWFAIETHGATAAWAKGYTGKGVNVAIIDTGVDFAHPDLQGTQARQPFGPYAGWPIAFDSRSMLTYLFSGGLAFPSVDIWYSDTSSTNTTGYVVTETSKSGIYHIGLHPDDALKAWWYGEYVAVLVVDEHKAGVYDTVYVDLNNNKNFTDDKPCFKGNEIAYADLWGPEYTGPPDGLADISGGMIYFIADGVNGVPYSDVISWVYGIPNVIPRAGSLVAFMINDATENGEDHGTLCASAVAAQGTTGWVWGMAPDAKIISIGNLYQGGNIYDMYYFATEGYDGIPGTGDEANLVSMSYGVSAMVNIGYDFESRFVDYITTFYNPYVTFLGATGNGGHGYGTVTTPGGSTGIISVGASTEYWFFEPWEDLDQVTWGDVQPWSNRGPNAVGQVDPDVVAIGAWGTGDLALNIVGEGSSALTVWGGTSMSTPAAAGVTALMYQAYVDNHGFSPTSEKAREIMMSSATNLNYDPLVQGAGMVNGDRATDLASESGGILVSPPFWTAGEYHGTEYPAFTNVLHPGDTATTTFTLTNTKAKERGKPSSVTVTMEDAILVKTGEYEFSVRAHLKKEDPYDLRRPDYLHEITDKIPPETKLLKVFAYFPFEDMDKNADWTNTENNNFRLVVYDWKDLDGDGVYWNDFNHNGVVNVGELEPNEINRYTYGYPSGTALEARVHDPEERSHDGILVGLQHRYGSTIRRPWVNINIKVEFYDRADWNMLEVNPLEVTIRDGKSATIRAKVSVPKDAPYGLYEGTIIADDGIKETVIPVIIHVASDTSKFEFGGTPPSDTLYDNGRVFGGFDWRWRYESGDWRFYYVDVPEEEITLGTKLLVDVDWATMPTDIDVFVYGPEPDVFSAIWPDRYGPYTLDFKGGSVNTYMGSGIFTFQTSTGESQEVISADAVPGLNLIALHNVLYNDEFGEPFNAKVGTFSVIPYPVSIATSVSTGTQPISVVSTLDLPGVTAMAFGVSQPEKLVGQTISQDDPADPMTASWTKEYVLANAGVLDVYVHVGANDLDLYILYDMDDDGVPEPNEIIAQSTNPAGTDDFVKILLPSDGRYWVFVHGWAVSPSPSSFDIDITIIQGNMLTVSDLPTGPVAAGTTVHFNLDYDLDGLAEGTWQGLLFVGPINAPTAVAVPVEIIYTLS